MEKNHIDRARQPRSKRQGAGRGRRFRGYGVLFTAEPGQTLTIDITTSVDNSRGRWEALFNRLQTVSSLPAGKLTIPRLRRDAGRGTHSYRTGF